MTAIVGVDPGLSGAIAVYEPTLGLLEISDIPAIEVKTKGKSRTRLDIHGLVGIASVYAAVYDAKLAVIEKVSSSPQQGVTSAFSFGYTAGAIYAAFASVGYAIEMVAPAKWKPSLRVPADKKAATLRANELLPGYAHLWTGPRGAALHDRAEAALLAKYGWDNFGGGR